MNVKNFFKQKKRTTLSCERHQADDPSIHFRINIYYVILDRLKSALLMRSAGYMEFSDKFGFMNNLTSLSPDQIRQGTNHPLSEYSNDLTSSFEEKLVHFTQFLKTVDDHNVQNMLLLIRSESLQSVYPCTDIVLCIFLSNCTRERYFSKLKRIMSYGRPWEILVYQH